MLCVMETICEVELKCIFEGAHVAIFFWRLRNQDGLRWCHNASACN